MTTDSAYHIPDDRYYLDEHHMWAKPEDGLILIGMDTLGLASLGDLAYVSLEPENKRVKAGESLGAVEAAKMTGDIIAPISGKIVKRNMDAVSDPSIVNDDPYARGWLVVIEPDDWEGEYPSLIGGDALPDWIAAETDRYKAKGWI